MNINEITPNRVWGLVFAFWTLFLSGVVASPGTLQAVRLHDLLADRQTHVEQVQEDIRKLQTEAEELEKNKVVQQREIRRVLGYAANDELIFDFSSGSEEL